MTHHPEDTICAIATAAGGAARGMVRVSGADAVDIVARVFQVKNNRPLHLLRQPTVVPGEICIDLDFKSRRLPCDSFVWPTKRSYTREPVVELHTFGSSPVLESLVSVVCEAGARLAEPGEFTLRAFLAGRIDLTQAEAVLGVIDAQGTDQLSDALVQLAGGLARPLNRVRDDLLQLLAELEAGLDFVEEDIELISAAEVSRQLNLASEALVEISDQMASRYVGPTENQVVLLGKPNAGKSSLFNAIVNRHGIRANALSRPIAAALVSSQQGTTRDYLTATISLDGLLCEIVDTAGADDFATVRTQVATESAQPARADSPSDIDTAARVFATERSERAVLRLLCIDASEIAACRAPTFAPRTANYDVIVVTKADHLQHQSDIITAQSNVPMIATSSVLGTGLDELCDTLRRKLTGEQTAQRGQTVASTANRCRASIQSASEAVAHALEIASVRGGHELIAVEIRASLHELGKVVGTVYTDDLLDRIFSTFCIGK
jgi:tRNA modification GTPase